MELWFNLYCLLFVALANSVSSLQPSCSDRERLALLQFKDSFRIDCALSTSSSARPKVQSWTDDGDCCSWDGVECDAQTGQVIGLDLSSSCLYGSFPPNSSLFGLAHLQELNLADNYFKLSQVPSKLGQFQKLKSLNLSSSAFSGRIPSDISKLSQLSLLDLSYNGASLANSQLNLRLDDRSFERLIQNLTHLQIIYLDKVDISSNFPVTLTNLTSLKELSLILCNLYGDLPHSLFHLPCLEILRLGGNTDLTGTLPQSQWQSPLRVLSLSAISFSGDLPPSIGKLTNLETLQVTNCQFSGLFPSFLSNLTKLANLILNRNNFYGDISFSMENLTNLNTLGLSNLNVMPGQLFSELPKLHKLTNLALAGMKIEPQFLSVLANITNLELLDLGNTKLKGPLPEWIANLPNLRTLFLNDNELVGPISQWVSQLTNLSFLDLSNNFLSGNINSFFNLKNLLNLGLSGTNISFPLDSGANAPLLKLKNLGLSDCNLTEFPQFLRHQNELQLLLINNNNIDGLIPQWFVEVTKESLLSIDLSGNNLTGFEQPAVVLPWTNLEQIDLSSNKFHGQLPIPPNSIVAYSASSNQFKGDIPAEICNARSLISLDLSNNTLSGKIPSCIVDQLAESLQMLDLRGNNFQGRIPPTFTRSCKLKMINLSNNQLEGGLPRSLINCKMLKVIDIGSNRVTDTFPKWLGSLPMLHVLVLSHNKFHGSIAEPKSDQDFSLLRIIDLSSNLHTGNLPSTYLQNWHAMGVSEEDQYASSNIKIFFLLNLGPYDTEQVTELDYSITITNKGTERLYSKILKVFKVIDFSSNNFTGRIPEIIGNLQGLQALNLSNNNLEESIPSSLANMTALEALDLSLNKLSGEIPSALSESSFLEVFNVSYNQLEGPIPNGNQFSTFDASSFMGNARLCGRPLSKVCNLAVAAPSGAMNSHEESENTEFIDWFIKSLGCVIGCIVGIIIGKVYITDKYHEWFIETFTRQRPRRRAQRVPRRRRIIQIPLITG